MGKLNPTILLLLYYWRANFLHAPALRTPACTGHKNHINHNDAADLQLSMPSGSSGQVKQGGGAQGTEANLAHFMHKITLFH